MSNQYGPNWGESNNWYWEDFSVHWRVLGRENQNPIVLLHGFGASSAHWRENAGCLASEGFRVYAIDLLGFGKSEQPSPKKIRKLDNLVWAKQLEAFIEEIVQPNTNQKVALIGNSLGSLVALTTAIRNPDLVAALVASPLPEPVLISPFYTKQSRSIGKIKKAFVKIFFKLLPLEILVPLIARTPLINIGLQAAYHSSIKFDKPLQKLVCTPARREKAATALRAMCIGMASRPKAITAPLLIETLAKSSNRCPFLLIWGEEDKIIPLMLGQRLKKEYPWIDFLVLENTGHCPHDESPNKFNKLLINWLGLNLGVKVAKT